MLSCDVVVIVRLTTGHIQRMFQKSTDITKATSHASIGETDEHCALVLWRITYDSFKQRRSMILYRA
jgi:hypothetical protein